MKKLISIILTICLCAALSLSAAAKEYISDEVISAAKNGVAMIVSESSTGSAVAIGIKGEPVHYFLTNCHCVTEDDWITPSKGLSIAVGDATDPSRLIEAAVVYSDDAHDFAIVKTEEPVLSVVPQTLYNEKVRNGETVFALGFSGESRLDGKIIATKNNLVYADGEITNLSYDIELNAGTDDAHDVKDTYMTTMRISNGYSGGPLCNTNGYVIGLNNASSQIIYSDGTVEYSNSYAVKIDRIIEILDANNIPYEEYTLPTTMTPAVSFEPLDEETEPTSDSITVNPLPSSDTKQPKAIDPVLLWIIIVIAMAGCIILVVWSYKRAERKAKGEDTAKPQPKRPKAESTSAAAEEKPVAPIEIVQRPDTSLSGSDTPTRLNIIYRLVIEDSTENELYSTKLDDGCRYRIAIKGDDIAEISIHDSRLAVTSTSDSKAVYIVDTIERNGYQLLMNSEKSSDSFRIDASKHMYLIDTDHHVSIECITKE